MMPSWLGYVEARRRLDERFGNPFVLSQCYLKRLEKWPSISRDDVKWLDDFTTFLIGCRNAMIATESIKELDYPTSLRLIVSKLPGYLQDGWARVADKILYHEGNLVTFNKLVEFLESENRIRLNPVFGKAALSSTNRNKGGASNQNRKVTSAGTVAKTMSDKTPAHHAVSVSESLCMFCELPHSFITCRKFCKILHKDKDFPDEAQIMFWLPWQRPHAFPVFPESHLWGVQRRSPDSVASIPGRCGSVWC